MFTWMAVKVSFGNDCLKWLVSSFATLAYLTVCRVIVRTLAAFSFLTG